MRSWSMKSERYNNSTDGANWRNYDWTLICCHLLHKSLRFVGEKKILLKSSDGETFEVEQAVAAESQAIKNLIEAGSVDNVIPINYVTGKTLAKVIEYCKNHVEASAEREKMIAAFRPTAGFDEALENWDSEFVKVDKNTLFDFVRAATAKYLDIKSLLKLTCMTMADMIKGMTAEEIYKTFNNENDIIPEEEEEGSQGEPVGI